MTMMRRPGAWPQLPTWPDERIDRVFRDMFREYFSGTAMLDRLLDVTTNPMHIEEFVDGDTCVIRAELPGVDPDKDIELTVSGGMLHMSAQREERKEEERPDGYHSEFRYGSFRRSVRLPDGATESDVKANYKDGILEIRIPMPNKDASTTKRVPIEH